MAEDLSSVTGERMPKTWSNLLNRRMAALVLLSFFWWNGGAARAGEDVCRPEAGTQIITREEIVHSGAARMSELFMLVDGWSAHSIDGYSWTPEPHGLTAPEHPRWHVFVDGQFIELAMLGRQNVNLLPVHPLQVACVTVKSIPAAVAGRISPSGSIHIHTRRPPEGVTVDAALATGSEIGDPGPFRYTPLATRNIDRIGPNARAGAAVAGENSFLRAGLTVDEFHTTDEQLESRMKVLYVSDDKPRINVRAIGVGAGVRVFGAEQRLLAGSTRTEDLLLVETAGAEIPATRKVSYAGASFSSAVGRGILDLTGGYLSHDLARRPNRDRIDLDWREDRLNVSGRLRLGDDRLGGSVGGGLDRVRAVTARPLSDDTILRYRAYLDFSVSPAAWLRQHAALEWNHERGASSAVAVAQSLFERSDVAAALTLSLGSRRVDADRTPWFWISRGLEIPVQDGSVIDPIPALSNPIVFTADAEATYRPDPRLRVTAGGFYRRFTGEFLPIRDVGFRATTTALRVKTGVLPDLRGSVAGIDLRLRLLSTSWLGHDLSYRFLRPVAADLVFIQSRASTPEHLASATMTAGPIERFTVFMRFQYRSAVTFPEYGQADMESAGFYPSALPEMFLLDIAATKLLWHDRLRASAAFRNVLNEPHRTHPAGAVVRTSFHIAVEVLFNSRTGF